MKKKKIGDIMVEAGLITSTQLQEALRDQKNLGGRLGAILFDKAAISETNYLRALTSQLGIPAADFRGLTIPEKVMKLVPRELAWEKMMVPMAVQGNGHGRVLLLAMVDPTDVDAIEKVKQLSGCSVKPLLALESVIRLVLMEYYEDQYGRGDYRLAKEVPSAPAAPAANPVAVTNTRVREPASDQIYIGQEKAQPTPPAPSAPESPAVPAAVVVEDDNCSDAYATLTLELRAFLKLLIEKGVLKPGEYTEALNRARAAAKTK
jgi:hypothetical protein